MNPVFSILKNTATGRFHPILFTERPLPGPPADNKPIRWKSFGHHTMGFDTREEALASIRGGKEEVEDRFGTLRFAVKNDFEWDGNGIPAIVHLFTTEDLSDTL